MKLVERTVSDYLAEVASSAPAPGGGTAAALCGAQGAALTAMVAALTLGKKKYAEFEAVNRAAAERAKELERALEGQVDADADAYALVSAAYGLPKETDEEKARRRTAVADATRVATAVPFRTLALAEEALEVARTLAGRSNANCASDLGVAAASLSACATGAWLNVRINLGGLADEAERARFAEDGARRAAACEALAREILDAVDACLG